MADDTTLQSTTPATAPAGLVIAGDDVGGVFHQRVKVQHGADGSATDVSAASPLPVVQTGSPTLPTGAATEATQSAGNTLTGAVTETAPASDTASSGLNGRLQRIAQRLTSLIALLPTSLGAGGGLKVDGSGTPLPVEIAGGVAIGGNVEVVNDVGNPLPVSAASLPLPTGAATETTLAAASGKLPATLGQKAMAASLAVVVASDQSAVPVSAASLPLPTGAATEVSLAAAAASLSVVDDWDESDRAKINPIVGQAGVAAGSGVVGATVQRVVLATDVGLPAGANALGTVTVSNPTTNPETGLAKDVTLGSLTEAAPATDTASSGLNGRLQRIAQRLTSLISLLPASLGQKTAVNSLAVTIASDQSAVPASQSGTWTVQPGNTANTTAWKVDGSAVTQPVSAASLPLPTGAATSAGAGNGASVQVTVTNSSTSIIAARAARRAVLILNLQTVPVYVDASGGTATTSHFRLDPGASLMLATAAAVTGITSAAYTASGDAKVHTVELY